MNIAYFLNDAMNTATILHVYLIEITPSVAFLDASGLVGDTKQLYLPRLDGFCSESGNLLLFT